MSRILDVNIDGLFECHTVKRLRDRYEIFMVCWEFRVSWFWIDWRNLWRDLRDWNIKDELFSNGILRTLKFVWNFILWRPRILKILFTGHETLNFPSNSSPYLHPYATPRKTDPSSIPKKVKTTRKPIPKKTGHLFPAVSSTHSFLLFPISTTLCVFFFCAIRLKS